MSSIIHSPVLKRLRPLTSFLRQEASGAVVLLAASFVALVWANSPFSTSYGAFWERELTLGVRSWSITEDLRHWINDGSMAVFFFVVALEIKREVTVGELEDSRATALPVAAALTGMILPALLYVAITAGTEAVGGWGIPVATDIAFALGVLTLFGRRLPAGLKALLLAIAIADDVGAILIIAFAYSEGLSAGWLGASVAIFALIAVVRFVGATSPWWYVLPALAAWVATLESGVHATIAGVVLGLMTPAHTVDNRPVLEQLQQRLHPVSSYLVLPLFALANAGVTLSLPALRQAAISRLAIGIVVGLVVGKTVGIAFASWAMTRTGIGRLPLGVDLRHVIALAPVAGIGFTVSLFIAGLTFEGPQLDEAKMGVLVASAVSGGLGAGLLKAAGRRLSAKKVEPDVPPISAR